MLAAGTGSDPRFRARPAASARRAAVLRRACRSRVARELRSFRPDAVVAESPYEAVAVELARRASRGRAAQRGRRGARRLAHARRGSTARRCARAARAARRPARGAGRSAAPTRCGRVSPFTAGLVRAARRASRRRVHRPSSDLDAVRRRRRRRCPEQPRALFVGVLERYKNVDGLAAAWRLVARRACPEARLRDRRATARARELVEALVARLPAQTSGRRGSTPAEVAAALDEARVLVLPSRSEGLAAVVVEALCRGRAGGRDARRRDPATSSRTA